MNLSAITFGANSVIEIDDVFVARIKQWKIAKTTTFNDVAKNYWAIKEINSLFQKNIITGYPNKIFKPDKELTRAETAVIMSKIL